MDILNIATQWAKAEIFSSKFFVIIAVLLIATSIGFWQLGKSELARSYIVPMAICGGLLMVIGIGLTYNNEQRLKAFPTAYDKDKVEFVQSELKRTEATIKQTENTIFKWIPIIIITAALLIIFVDKPSWRAACITTIAMMVVLLIVDSNSHSRIVSYNKALKSVVANSK